MCRATMGLRFLVWSIADRDFMCCRLAFLIIAAIAAIQTVASSFLYRRTRSIYRQEFLRLKKFEAETHASHITS